MVTATTAAVRHSIKLSVCRWIYVHRFILDSLHKLRLMVFYIYYVYLDGFVAGICHVEKSFPSYTQTVCLPPVSTWIIVRTGREFNFTHLKCIEFGSSLAMNVYFERIASFGQYLRHLNLQICILLWAMAMNLMWPVWIGLDWDIQNVLSDQTFLYTIISILTQKIQ